VDTLTASYCLGVVVSLTFVLVVVSEPTLTTGGISVARDGSSIAQPNSSTRSSGKTSSWSGRERAVHEDDVGGLGEVAGHFEVLAGECGGGERAERAKHVRQRDSFTSPDGPERLSVQPRRNDAYRPFPAVSLLPWAHRFTT
jgi:hypothetical protein